MLTHVDQLAARDAHTAAVFLDSIVKATSTPRFAVLGRHEGGFAEEDRALAQCSSVASRPEIQRGTSALNRYIEEKIALHLDAQVPKLQKALEAELKTTTSRLAQIEEQDPLSLIYTCITDIRHKIESSLQETELVVRQIQEK